MWIFFFETENNNKMGFFIGLTMESVVCEI